MRRSGRRLAAALGALAFVLVVVATRCLAPLTPVVGDGPVVPAALTEALGEEVVAAGWEAGAGEAEATFDAASSLVELRWAKDRAPASPAVLAAAGVALAWVATRWPGPVGAAVRRQRHCVHRRGPPMPGIA